MQTLGWGFPAERLAWAAVELGCDGVQVLAVVHRKVGALREVLPQQSVGVSFEPRCQGLAGSRK